MVPLDEEQVVRAMLRALREALVSRGRDRRAAVGHAGDAGMNGRRRATSVHVRGAPSMAAQRAQ